MSTARRLLALAAAATTGYTAYRLLWQQAPLRDIPLANPFTSFDAALAAAYAQAATREPGMRPDTGAIVLTHDEQTDRAIVLLHGFTNCPLQFKVLAEQYHARGYNVFVPRFPYHGLYNRAPKELAALTAEDIVRTGMTAVDIARGLGRHVTILGLSMGGLVTAWLAQQRADIDRAVMVAPALAFQPVPFATMPLHATYAQHAPARFVWWDPVNKGQTPGPEYAYYGFHLRGFAALLRLAVLVGDGAGRAAPQARSLALVLNPTDESIDNDGVLAVAKRWRRRGANIAIHTFPADWRLTHDLIDPGQPTQQIDRVYPLLMQWSEFPYYVAPPVSSHAEQNFA